MEQRPLSDADAPQIHDLVRKWETFWKVPRVSTRSRAMEWLSAPSVVMATDTRSFWDGGVLIAYGLVSYIPSNRSRNLAHAFGIVDPARIRKGIGGELLQWQIERSRERLSSGDPTLPRVVRAVTWDWIAGARPLFLSAGLEEVRRYDEMLKPLQPGSVARRSPDGVEMVRWDPARNGEALLANNESFADHWGATPLSPGTWQHILESPETRLDLSHQAIARGNVVGMSVNSHYPDDHQVTGRREGWIRILSVIPEWRRRGVATALLNASHETFLKAGYTHALLRVDALSLTSANRLYETLGYQTIRAMNIHELTL